MVTDLPPAETRAGKHELNAPPGHTLHSGICSWNAARMDPPHLLLDTLNDSVTSGTFVDTKFYVFSRREASGRVGSPRALYCNSRILDTVPYFSTCG